MFNAAIAATLIPLKCPRCGLVQVRAKLPAHARYECRDCGEKFNRKQGRARELAEAYLAGKRDL